MESSKEGNDFCYKIGSSGRAYAIPAVHPPLCVCEFI